MVTTDTAITVTRTNIGGSGGTGTIIDTTTIATMIGIDARRSLGSLLSWENDSSVGRGGIAAYDAIVDPATSDQYLSVTPKT